MNVWVGPVEDPGTARPVTKEKKRGIPDYFWAFTNQHILYTQDSNGDEDFHLYCVDLKAGETKDLTPLEKVRAELAGHSHKFPREVLVLLNDRDPQFHDLYRVDVATGERKLVQKNTDFAGFIADDDYRVRFAEKFVPDGGLQVYKPDGKDGWAEFLKIPAADTGATNLAGLDQTAHG